MTNQEQIEQCINLYYAGCCESNSEKIKEAFDERKQYKNPSANPDKPILNSVEKNTLFFVVLNHIH